MMERSSINTGEALKQRIEHINQQIEQAARDAGRDPAEVTLLAATKTVPATVINEAIGYGIRYIGENRVQELLEKYDDLDLAHCHLHFIGHLQTNKVKYIVDKVEMIHSVDHMKLAREIDRQCAAIGKVMPILIEVNIGREESKSGVLEEDLEALVREAAQLPHVRISGLMAIPPICEDEEELAALFDRMYRLFIAIQHKKIDNVYMETLSMGMSSDHTIAIAHSSNLVRIGTALFGARK